MTRRRLSPEQRRDELLAAAAALVLDEGIDALSLEVVAERAGCSRNLAYTYFPNQAALIEALTEAERTLVSAAMLERIPDPASFDEWGKAWLEVVLDLAETRGPLLLLTFQETMTLAGPSGRRADRGAAADQFAARLTDGAGVDDPAEARALAHVLGGAIIGGIVAVASGRSSRPVVEQQLQRVLGVLSRMPRP
jgi:AcrR family transcriptional regulator